MLLVLEKGLEMNSRKNLKKEKMKREKLPIESKPPESLAIQRKLRKANNENSKKKIEHSIKKGEKCNNSAKRFTNCDKFMTQEPEEEKEIQQEKRRKPTK